MGKPFAAVLGIVLSLSRAGAGEEPPAPLPPGGEAGPDLKAVRQAVVALEFQGERLQRAKDELAADEKELKKARDRKRSLEEEMARIQDWAKKAGPGAKGYEGWMTRYDKIMAKNPKEIAEMEGVIPGLERKVEAGRKAVAAREPAVEEAGDLLRAMGPGALPEVEACLARRRADRIRRLPMGMKGRTDREIDAYFSRHPEGGPVPILEGLRSEWSPEMPPSGRPVEPEAPIAPLEETREEPPGEPEEAEDAKAPPDPADAAGLIREIDACSFRVQRQRVRREKALKDLEREKERLNVIEGQISRWNQGSRRSGKADMDGLGLERDQRRQRRIPEIQARVREAEEAAREAEEGMRACEEGLRSIGAPALPAVVEALKRTSWRAETQAALARLKRDLAEGGGLANGER